MTRDEYKKSIEDAVNAKLGKRKNAFQYKKNDNEMYSLLSKLGSQDSAINWAKELANGITGRQFANYNPQTMVFKLVEELNGQSEELNAEIIKKHGEGQ